MSRFELVIFNCDGVLVDSERIANRVFCTMLNELGLTVTLQDMFEHFVGLSMPQCVQLIADMRGTLPPPGFIEDLQRRLQQPRWGTDCAHSGRRRDAGRPDRSVLRGIQRRAHERSGSRSVGPDCCRALRRADLADHVRRCCAAEAGARCLPVRRRPDGRAGAQAACARCRRHAHRRPCGSRGPHAGVRVRRRIRRRTGSRKPGPITSFRT